MSRRTLRFWNIILVIIAVSASAVLLIVLQSAAGEYRRMDAASRLYIQAYSAAEELDKASDYLTDLTIDFAVTGEVRYLREFDAEVSKTKTRHAALDKMSKALDGEIPAAMRCLRTAMDKSKLLVKADRKAMRYIVEAGEYEESDVPKAVSKIELNERESAMSAAELRNAALELLTGQYYISVTEEVDSNTDKCLSIIRGNCDAEIMAAASQLEWMIYTIAAMTVTLLMTVMAYFFIIIRVRRKVAA